MTCRKFLLLLFTRKVKWNVFFNIWYSFARQEKKHSKLEIPLDPNTILTWLINELFTDKRDTINIKINQEKIAHKNWTTEEAILVLKNTLPEGFSQQFSLITQVAYVNTKRSSRTKGKVFQIAIVLSSKGRCLCLYWNEECDCIDLSLLHVSREPYKRKLKQALVI